MNFILLKVPRYDAAALFELQVKIFLNSRVSQLNYSTNNGTDTEKEISFKNKREFFKQLKEKDSKNIQQVTKKTAVKTLREFCRFEGEKEDFERVKSLFHEKINFIC